jgi:hypothetical protein
MHERFAAKMVQPAARAGSSRLVALGFQTTSIFVEKNFQQGPIAAAFFSLRNRRLNWNSPRHRHAYLVLKTGPTEP